VKTRAHLPFTTRDGGDQYSSRRPPGDLRSGAQGIAGQLAEPLLVGGGELAWVGPALGPGHSGNGHAVPRDGALQFAVGAVQPDAAQVLGREKRRPSGETLPRARRKSRPPHGQHPSRPARHRRRTYSPGKLISASWPGPSRKYARKVTPASCASNRVIRALRFEEDVAGPEHRFRLAVHTEHGRTLDDAADHGAVVHMQPDRVAGDYPDPPHLDAAGVLGLREARVEQHVPGPDRDLWP
jgi:hypothetical protein